MCRGASPPRTILDRLNHFSGEGSLGESFDLSELLDDFRDEGRTQVAQLDAALARVERGETVVADERTALLRALHTLKGNAGMMGLRPVQDFVHALEEVFRPWDGTPATLPLDALHPAAAALRRAVDRAGGDGADEAFAALTALRPSLAAAAASAVVLTAARPEAPSSPTAPVAAPAAPAGVAAAETAHEKPTVDVPETGAPAAESPSAAAGPPPSAPASPGLATDAADLREDTLRIPFARLDALLSRAGELGIAVAALEQWAADHREMLVAAGTRRSLGDRLESLGAAAEAVRRGAAELRTIPVGRIFSRFPALARDIARAQGKRVRVVLEGEDTGVDKATADALAEPLLHLIRNAVDHGIEPPAAREAAGKPAEGTLWLRAVAEGEQVRIEVEDDGTGLDAEAIVRHARERGLLAEGEVADAAELVFRPGFSTRGEATELSGRGVGLDVVRSTVAALRGGVEVGAGAGGGTTFVLRLPLTVALLPALFLEAGGEVFAIPAVDVEETLRTPAVQRVGAAEMVDVRGELLPLVRLERLFGWEERVEPRFVVVIRRGTRAAAVGAERLLAQRPATVRALPDALGAAPGVSGATLDATGRVVLLLDAEEILEMNVDLYRGGGGDR